MDNLDLPLITDIEETDIEEETSLEIASPDNLKIDLDKKTVKAEDIFVIDEDKDEDKEEDEDKEIPVKKTKRRPLRKKREKLKPNDSFLSMTEATDTEYPQSEYTETEDNTDEPKKKKFQVRNPQKVSERRQRKKQEKIEIINRKKEEDEQIYYRGLAEMELDRIVSQQRGTTSFQPRKLTRVKFTEEEQQEPMKEPIKEPVKEAVKEPVKEPVKPIQKASKRQVKPKTTTKKAPVVKQKTIQEVNPYDQYF